MISWSLFLLAAMVLSPVFVQPAEAAGPVRGEQAPGFILSDLTGGQYKLPDNGRGKILIFHFWGSTCGYCREEIRILRLLHQENRKDLLPLSINVGETPLVVKKFIDKLEPGYPVLLDSNSAVAKQYGILGIPVTFLVDREGIIRFRIFGEINEKDLRKLLNVMLARK
jgi:peroxiredoxin